MKNNQKTLSLTLGATFVLMALLVTYTASLMYTSSHSYIDELGNDKAAAITADLENYLETAARNKDTDFIKANHGAFIKSFKELAGKILT